MQNQNPIDITLCRRIAYEEWKNFKKSQDITIGAKLKKDTGLLHAGGARRCYSITTNKNEIVASLLHPDYLRYQDMRKLKHGRFPAHVWQHWLPFYLAICLRLFLHRTLKKLQKMQVSKHLSMVSQHQLSVL